MVGEQIAITQTPTFTIEPTVSEGTTELTITGEVTSTSTYTLTPGITLSTENTMTPSVTSTLTKPPPTATISNPTYTPDHPTDTSTPQSSPGTNTAIPPTKTNTPIPPTATAEPPATMTPEGCAFSGNSTYENQVVALINQERTNRGLPELVNNSSLRLAARRHSEDMACNDIFSHTGSDGSTLSSRILAAGYNYSWAAENIAASSSSSFSASAVVSMWMNSTGHKKNILNENAVHIGVGFRYAGDSDSHDYDAFYTADFGRP